MTNKKRNHVVIPFNKDRMTLKDMERSVGALEAIIVRWHAVEAKRQAEVEADGFSESYEEMVDEFFWDVNGQIQQISTWKLEEEKKND